MDDDVTISPTTPAQHPTPAPSPTPTDGRTLPIDQIMHHFGVEALIYNLDDGPLVVVPYGPES